MDEASGDRVDAKDLLTPQAAADLVNVSRPFVVRHIDAGDIPVVMVGSRQRVRKQDVLAWHERVQNKSAMARSKLLDAVDDELRG
ncbi:excisionase family DNA-binding protein [Comamonadaceae bacterium BS-T2-15]|uniref:Excisionase family DNA-binding protein n=1 Tax=Scleromatobacter humisilvae TaxID=2897159 RepID=A0A9X1YQQ8_9BURK|nr:excisionase family DNA-binding protein [Scleromatobacter humisilvae]MCK9689563.1 excisionase family DNA-binding protein [Scleromatobacter humisilvae]